jgi:methionyl-tRNA formyltransferase
MTSAVDNSTVLMQPPQKDLSRQRILFLGNEYNPFSIISLEALSQLQCEVIVGVHDPLSRGLWRTLRKSIQTRGLPFVLFKARRLAESKISAALRRLGIRLSKFQSLPELCRERGLCLLRIDQPNSEECVERLRALQVDLILVAAFSHILKPALLQIPRLGCINVHPSLLPRYRGPNPCYWVLARGERSTGITIHHMDDGIDSGDLIEQAELLILPDDDEWTLRVRAAQLGARRLPNVIRELVEGQAPRIPQDESLASYYPFPPKGASIL